MNTKLIMTLTAILLAILGLTLTFAPDQMIMMLGMKNSIVLSLILQLLGAMYFAFAMLNWMAKGAIIGGIYNKPIAIANLSHFLISGLALTKAVLYNHQLPIIFIFMAGLFIILAVIFWLITSRHPETK